MKKKALLLFVVWFVESLAGLAQAPASDPVADYLYPPDFVMQQQRAVGLNDEQRSFIEAEVQKTQLTLRDTERVLREHTEKLASLLKAERVNESEVLTQIDKLSDLEREDRRAQLKLLIKIKNKLTTEQQTKLQDLKIGIKAIQSKAEQVQAGVERWQQEGRDPSPAVQIMQDLEPLVRDGKLKEAAAVLDRALKALSAAKAE